MKATNQRPYCMQRGDTAEDQNIKREMFMATYMNRASFLARFKQEELIIIIKIETTLLVPISVNSSMWMW